jgi:hypothetical protein
MTSEHPLGWALDRVVALVLAVAAVVLFTSCGRAIPVGTGASPSGTGSPVATATPSTAQSPSPSWQMYTSQQYGFSVSYPPAYSFEVQGSGPPGGLAVYRIVDDRYLSGYPPGEVDLGLYQMDATTLRDWITRHTGISTQGHTYYWESTANTTDTTAAGQPAVSFDWTGGVPTPIHATAFLKDSSTVVLFDWWATDTTYSSTIQLCASQVLASFKG